MSQWKVKHIDDDKVLHLMLHEYVFRKRSDAVLLSRSEQIDVKESVDLYLINTSVVSAADLSQLQENPKVEVITFEQEYSTTIKNLTQSTLSLKKGKDSIIKIEELIIETIYRLTDQLRLTNKAS